MATYRYNAVFEPLREGGYNVVFPAIPEICTFGETLEDAKKMADDALRCYLESTLKEGGKIPQDLEATVEKVTVSI
jgi:predicted RNase H-like HicB family nuclease